MRSSADDGGEGGVEKARVPYVISLPPTDALLFLGLESAPYAGAGLGRAAISVMGRNFGWVFVLCLSFAIVTSGDAISSSSSWKSQTLDSTGAVALPSLDRSSGCDLRLKCLLYVVSLLRGFAPESGRVAMMVDRVLFHGVAIVGGCNFLCADRQVKGLRHRTACRLLGFLLLLFLFSMRIARKVTFKASDGACCVDGARNETQTIGWERGRSAGLAVCWTIMLAF